MLNLTQSNYSTNPYFYQLKLPLDLAITLDENDPVFLLKRICSQLNYTSMMNSYSDRGRKAKLSPSTLFSVIVYAYMNGVYSSREIEKRCQRDTYFMWLCEEKAPDHSTISRFRNLRLGTDDVMEDLFYQFCNKLVEVGEISLINLFIDGTKLEANANKYTFVWKKATLKNQEKLLAKLLNFIVELNQKFSMNINQPITCSDELRVIEQELLARIEKEGIVISRGKGRQKTELQKYYELIHDDYYPRLKKYEMTLQICREDRNSYSKTDHDATFMHMKDDHMGNGQLKAGYNVQIGVENEYITAILVNSERSDCNCFIPLVEKTKQYYPKKFDNIIADSGYYSEENLVYTIVNQSNPYIKPVMYEQMKTRKYQNNPYDKVNMPYDETKDEYTCPNNRKLTYVHSKNKLNRVTGLVSELKIYQCRTCKRCTQKSKCTKAKGEKTIQVNQNLNQLTSLVITNLSSPMGNVLKMNRSIQAEGTFGDMKQNDKFNRYLTRGTSNVYTETLLYSFARNVNKLYTKIKNNKLGQLLYKTEIL